MKTGVLFNSSMALPAVQFLLSCGLPVELAIPDVENTDTPEIKHFLASVNKPYTTVSKPSLAAGLKRWIERFKLDVVLVITFPWKIPAYTLALPPLGFYNFHYALLPQYRGAQPLFWQMRNGETHGGLTIHRMDAGWDTGPIAQLCKIPIDPDDTYGLYTKRLIWQTLPAVQEFVQKLILMGNTLPLTPQDNTLAQYHPRPGVNDITINWETMTATQVRCLINACNPWTKGAYTKWQNNAFKIVQASVINQSIVNNHKLIPGMVLNCSNNKSVHISTVDNKQLEIEIISIDEGIFTADFLKRLGVAEGCVLK